MQKLQGEGYLLSMFDILMTIPNPGQEGNSHFSANNYSRIKYKHEKYTFKKEHGKCNTTSLENWALYTYVTILPFELSLQPVQGQNLLFTTENLLISCHHHIYRLFQLPNQSQMTGQIHLMNAENNSSHD